MATDIDPGTQVYLKTCKLEHTLTENAKKK